MTFLMEVGRQRDLMRSAASAMACEAMQQAQAMALQPPIRARRSGMRAISS
jgi:hypothetical protein